jgi:hypothetical protein|eukprot:TRINITY_DN2951_c0_g2_i1.p1 TRINITY_DN2951_c0_g2~~TRINITY_DN2951_c0_g2_i1.p1  ORF type:complete len:312 (+),score=56.60 TRINITY_DN2951_c0_g2_i1:61-936(+)
MACARDFQEILPAPLAIGVCTAKVALLLAICAKYKSTVFQPFSRCVCQFSALGCICRIFFFSLVFFLPDSDCSLINLLQDLSFDPSVVGVVVTMGLDFLWALSKEGDSSPIFDRNISESDFVARWYKFAVVFTLVLASIRFVPFPCRVELVYQWAIFLTLSLSFGFMSICLFKVRGTSKKPSFLLAFKVASAVIGLCTVLIAIFAVTVVQLTLDFGGQLGFFLKSEHVLETIGLWSIMSYFLFLKAPPSDLQECTTMAGSVAAVLKAKDKFKAGRKSKDSAGLSVPLVQNA